MNFLKFIPLLLLFSVQAQAAPLMQYAATVSTKQGNTESVGKMFVDYNKIRVEATVEGHDVYSIIRGDQGKLYSVLPSQKVYTEIPITQNDLKLMTPYSSETKMTPVGDETVNGIAATKYKIDESAGTVFLWLSKKNNTPIRMTADETGTQTNWTHLKPGAPDAKLFELPSGYQKIDISTGAAPSKTSASSQNKVTAAPLQEPATKTTKTQQQMPSSKQNEKAAF